MYYCSVFIDCWSNSFVVCSFIRLERTLVENTPFNLNCIEFSPFFFTDCFGKHILFNLDPRYVSSRILKI